MEDAKVTELAIQLFNHISQVTVDEFHWEDANFNSNLRRGRELLYLIANDGWIPSTTERIDISRANFVDTDLVFEADLTLIKHEAFRDDGGQVWLPLLVLPQSESIESVGDLRVTDAQGALQPTVQLARVRHAVAGAMAEIIVNAAAAHWRHDQQGHFAVHRDQYLLLSAALFRMLGGYPHAEKAHQDTPTERISLAKGDLIKLLTQYVDEFGGNGRLTAARQLTMHTAEVLDALSRAVVVAVAVDRRSPPSVFTVSAPTRPLGRPKGVRPGPVSWWRPLAELRIDLLLPSATADRYVEINLPDGVSLAHAGREGMTITVSRPRSAAMLEDLMDQVIKDPGGAEVLCLADLADAKAAVLSHTLSQHHLPDHQAGTVPEALTTVRDKLKTLTDSDGPPDGQLHAALKKTWEKGGWLPPQMLRKTHLSRGTNSTRTFGTLTGVARSDQVTTDQADPVQAEVLVPVQATEVTYVSAARLAGAMSAFLILAVAVFYSLFDGFQHLGRISPSVPDIGSVATALTLFAVILAGRADVPDRSTLRGYLSARCNWLIVASVMPSILLAIAIAFDDSRWVPVRYAVAMLAVQAILLGLMNRPVLYGLGGQRPRVLATVSAPEYERADVLRAAWWRTATANALVKNRPAFGYILWGGENGADTTLKSVLASEPQQTSNILSMLRVSFGARPMTFIVFRDPPGTVWAGTHYGKDIQLDLGEQAAIETPPDEIDVFVGSPGIIPSPVTAAAMRRLSAIASDHGLMVLNIRMPEPPLGGDRDRNWGRLRLGLREGESANLRALLHAMSRAMLRDVGREPSCRECHVLVRTARGGKTRFLHPPEFGGMTADVPGRRPVRASDLDPRKGGAPAYRVLALHSSMHMGIEREVLGQLASAEPDLSLVAITCAALHGTSVFLLLGALTDLPSAKNQKRSAKSLAQTFGQMGVHVDIDETWTGTDLGAAENAPLLRVLLRSPDRPGALNDAVSALSEALGDSLGQRADFWHGLMESGAARTTTVRLTRQLPAGNDVSDWDAGTPRAIEHRTRLGMTMRAAQRQEHPDNGGAEFGAPEDAVVDVRLIMSDAPP